MNVSGADYDLLPLIERALGVSTGDVAFPAAIEAAVNAGLIAEQQAPSSSRSGESPSLKSRLYRLRGNWVAVDGDSILAHNADLETLMTMVADRDAMVFYVPTDDRWPG